MASAAPQIRIVRPGTYTSAEGVRITFTPAMLQEAIDSYDASADPAPLVIGHPKLEDEAYGWVDRLELAADGALVAVPGDVEPSFAEKVRAKRYRKISAQWYLPHNPHNPTPGRLHLKHVGFFGAHPVGVKGLGTVSFAEDDDADVATIETSKKEAFMATEDTSNEHSAAIAEDTASNANANANADAGGQGGTDADAGADEGTTANADVDAGKPGEADQVSFAERQAEIDRREADLVAREADVAARETRARSAAHAGNVSFAEAQIAAGKLAPARKAQVIHLLDVLETTTEATASFGEGDTAVAPAALLRSLFEGAASVVSFGEAAPAGEDDQPATASFAAPSGYSADPKTLELHNRALQLQSGNAGLSYLDAVKQASAG